MILKQKSQLLYFLIFFLLSIQINGQEKESTDELMPWDERSEIDYRSPPYEKIENFKKNPSYNYNRHPENNGFFRRLWNMLMEKLISKIEVNRWTQYAVLILLILGFVYVILKFLNIPVTGLFSFSGKEDPSAQLELFDKENNTNEEELKRLYQLYFNNGAYREAVRILYLIYLKKLEKNNLIKIRYWKTNREYYKEIKNQKDQNIFQSLSKMYEYVWYGQYDLPIKQFKKIEQRYYEGWLHLN